MKIHKFINQNNDISSSLCNLKIHKNERFKKSVTFNLNKDNKFKKMMNNLMSNRNNEDLYMNKNFTFYINMFNNSLSATEFEILLQFSYLITEIRISVFNKKCHFICFENYIKMIKNILINKESENILLQRNSNLILNCYNNEDLTTKQNNNISNVKSDYEYLDFNKEEAFSEYLKYKDFLKLLNRISFSLLGLNIEKLNKYFDKKNNPNISENIRNDLLEDKILEKFSKENNYNSNEFKLDSIISIKKEDKLDFISKNKYDHNFRIKNKENEYFSNNSNFSEFNFFEKENIRNLIEKKLFKNKEINFLDLNMNYQENNISNNINNSYENNNQPIDRIKNEVVLVNFLEQSLICISDYFIERIYEIRMLKGLNSGFSNIFKNKNLNTLNIIHLSQDNYNKNNTDIINKIDKLNPMKYKSDTYSIAENKLNFLFNSKKFEKDNKNESNYINSNLLILKNDEKNKLHFKNNNENTEENNNKDLFSGINKDKNEIFNNNINNSNMTNKTNQTDQIHIIKKFKIEFDGLLQKNENNIDNSKFKNIFEQYYSKLGFGTFESKITGKNINEDSNHYNLDKDVISMNSNIGYVNNEKNTLINKEHLESIPMNSTYTEKANKDFITIEANIKESYKS